MLLLGARLLISIPVCALNGPLFAQVKVPIIVQEALYPGAAPIQRTNEPLTVGVPLPEYAGVRSASDFGLDGTQVGQFRVLARWPNGNVKWLLVDTQIDLDSTGKTGALILTQGHGNFGGDLLAKDYATKIVINTGAAQFTVRKSRFNLLDAVMVHNRSIIEPGTSHGLVLRGPPPGETFCGVCNTNYSSDGDSSSKAEIEENGPVRAVVKATGAHKDSRANVYMRFTVRITFYKGKSYIKVTSSLRNADDASSLYNSAFKGFSSYEIQLSPALNGNRSFVFGTHGQPVSGTFHGSENGELYQAYSSNLEHSHWSQVKLAEEPGSHRELLKSYIDRKISSEYPGTWEYAQEGYQVIQGSEIIVHGTRDQAVQGWADLRDSSGAGVLVGVQELSASWPKSLEFRSGGSDVRIGLWPRQNSTPYYQAWPQYSTQDVWLDFHDSALTSPSDEFFKLEHFLLGRAPISHYNDSGVFPFTLLDPKEEDAYYKSLGVACCAEDVRPSVVRFYLWAQPGEENQNDLRWAYLMQWLTRGLPGRYLTAAYFYRFVADQAFPRSDGFQWRTHPLNQLDFWGFPSVQPLNRSQAHRSWIDQNHAHWYGMTDYYFLSGDETIRDALLSGVKDRFLNKEAKLNTGSLGSARAVGAALMGFARFYDFLRSIQDPDADALLSVADGVLKKEVLPELSLSGFGNAPQGVSRLRGLYGNSGYTVKYHKVADVRVAQTFLQSILIQGIWEYAQIRGPLWTGYEEAMDLCYGLAQWALHEMFVQTPELSSSGFRYLIFLDHPNNSTDNPDFHVSALGNVMFPFFIVHEYTGDVGWKSKFEIALRKSSESYGAEWPRVANFGVSIAAHAILHPASRPRLVDVPLQVKADGRGEVELTWQAPANAIRYKLKFMDDRKIVDWLGFDPEQNRFQVDPNLYWPWFAARSLSDMQEPKPAGTTESLHLEGMDPTKTWSYVLRAYVPQ